MNFTLVGVKYYLDVYLKTEEKFDYVRWKLLCE